MGYDGLFINKPDLDKLRILFEKSSKFIIVKSLSQPTIEEVNSDKIMVSIEDGEVITHDTDTKKLEKFLKKNKINER